MADRVRALSWTTVVPVLALILLALTWGTKPGTPVLIARRRCSSPARCSPPSTTPRSSRTASASRSARSSSPSR